MVMIRKKINCKSFSVFEQEKIRDEIFNFWQDGPHITPDDFIVEVCFGKNHLLLSLVHFVSNKKCFRKKSKLYVLVISKTSLEQRHCTAANAAKMKCKMRIWDALLLHVLLINRFLGVFLSSFCFYFLYFFLVAVFNFLTHAL